jgi:hypothetical protein
MIVIAVICGLVVIGLATAGWYDYRARQRGRHFNLTSTEALQNRVDCDVRANLSFPGGQNWMNRDSRRGSDTDQDSD